MLFLSIHPRHVQAIVAGRKTVELRKRRPRAEVGSTIAIYATAPRCEVVAIGTLSRLQIASPACLWRRVDKYASVSKREFDAYFEKADTAVGIHLADINLLNEPLTLSQLRQRWDGFHPPQQFRYLDSGQEQYIRSQSMTSFHKLAEKSRLTDSGSANQHFQATDSRT